MSALPEPERAKLIKLIALASDSEHDGEALNALRAANRLVSQFQLTLLEALAAASTAVLDLRRLAELEQAAYERGYEKGIKSRRQTLDRDTNGPGSGGNVSPLSNSGRRWQDAAHELLANNANAMNSRSHEFVSDILLRRRQSFLTQPQENWLRDLCAQHNVQAW